jgi:adenylyltransferase/sulfurtransferase
MNDDELLRYSRHILLPQMDFEGQQRLLESHVMIVGLGGLGSPVAMYLAASGVGRLTLVDDDVVELSNLQRQLLYVESQVGQRKVDAAAERLTAMNVQVKLNLVSERLSESALNERMTDVDVLVDCTDNFAARFMLNRVSQTSLTPLVSGAAIRFEGQATVYDPRVGTLPCYRCLYDESGELEESCSESGILSPILGMIGGIQATETLKLLVGMGQSLAGRLLILDALNMQWREMKMKKNPHCPVCGGREENK